MEPDERLTVEQAADILCMPKQAVRVLMERGKLPIGIVEKMGGKGRRRTYYISRKRLEIYLAGKEEKCLTE